MTDRTDEQRAQYTLELANKDANDALTGAAKQRMSRRRARQRRRAKKVGSK